MHITRHLRHLADRKAYSKVITTKWVKEWHETVSSDFVTDPVTGEVTEALRSHWVPGPARPMTRKRRVHRRVKRWRNQRGFEVVNDSLLYVPDILRLMEHYLPALSEREGYDLRLLANPEGEPGDWFGLMTEEEIRAVRPIVRGSAASAEAESAELVDSPLW